MHDGLIRPYPAGFIWDRHASSDLPWGPWASSKESCAYVAAPGGKHQWCLCTISSVPWFHHGSGAISSSSAPLETAWSASLHPRFAIACPGLWVLHSAGSENAACGLAEAPRTWYLGLSRELLEVNMFCSQLDPCLYTLRRNGILLGICGIHVDDLVGSGAPEMDKTLKAFKKKMPFGDYRTYTIRYNGVEIRQNLQTMEIEVGQEAYCT